MKPKNFADLKAGDLKSLKGYKFTTNEALSLMRSLFESDANEEQKNNYLQFILSINPTSKVEWQKFLPHMQKMCYDGNSSGLAAFCAFFLEKGDKRDFLRHAPEFNRFLPIGYFFSILTINYRDDKKYYGKSSEEIICRMSDFLQHSKVAMPKEEEVDELILQCDSLKTGAQALEFFSRRGFVKGFSLNLAIAFLTQIKIASTASGVQGSFGVEEAREVFRSVELLEELEIDENKLRELLQSFTDPEELEILRYLGYNKTSKALIQKLLIEELADPSSARKIKDPQVIFDFLRSSEFRLNAAQAKDCLSQIKEKNPDIYAWSIYQLRHEIAEEFNGLGSNLSLQDLSELNAIFGPDNEVLQSFIDTELAKFPLEKIIEFVLEDGGNFDINFGWMIMPRASEINIERLNSIIEKCVSLPVKTQALQRFISLVKDSHFVDADEKKKFIKGLLGKMVEANKEVNRPVEFRGQGFLSYNFKNILETLMPRDSEIPVSLERNYVFEVIASLVEALEGNYKHAENVREFWGLLQYSADDAVDKEKVAELLRIALLRRDDRYNFLYNQLEEMIFEISQAPSSEGLGARYLKNLLLSQDDFRAIYLGVLSDFIANGSSHTIKFDRNNSNFTLKEIIETTFATRDKSGDAQRGFSEAFEALYSNRRINALEVSAANVVTLSLLIELMPVAFNSKSNKTQSLALKLWNEAVIENDLSEERDEELLAILEKIALVENLNLSAFYREFFSKISSGGSPEKKAQLERARLRIFGKMSPEMQLVFADDKMPEINYWQALKDCGKLSRSAFETALSNVERYCAAESDSEINEDLLLQLVILMVQKNVDTNLYLKLFAGFSEELKTLGNNKNFQEFFESLLQDSSKFAAAINLLSALKIEPRYLSEILQKAEIGQIVEMVIGAEANFPDRCQEIVKILIPRISARVEERGGIILFFDVQDYLKKRGFAENDQNWNKQKISFFNAVAPHIKIASQDNIFWDEFVQDWSFEVRNNGLKKLQFILATYSEDSATSSTELRRPIDLKYEGVSHKIKTMMQVSALFRFYPQLMRIHAKNLAADDALIAALSLSIKFYGAKFVDVDQFRILQEIYKEREKLLALDGVAADSSSRENIDFKQLLSCEKLLEEKEKFPKREASKALSKTYLGKALHVLENDKSFEKFYDSLGEKNQKILNLKKVSADQFQKLQEWVTSQIADLTTRYEAVKDLDLSKADMRDPKVRAQLQEKQKLKKFHFDHQEATLSVFDKMRLMQGLVKIPPFEQDLLDNSADVENYWAMFQNIHVLHGGCWTKFCANLANNLELCSLMSTEEELASSVSAQLGLVRQPNCYVNLQVSLQSELERRRYVRKDFAAIAMAQFQGVLPFITRDVHNYEPEKLNVLHLPRNNFCYLVGEELVKIVESSASATLGADPLKPQCQLLENLEDIKFITFLASVGKEEGEEVELEQEEQVQTYKIGDKEVELTQEQCVEIYSRNLKQFLLKQEIEFAADSLDEHRESFGAFLEEQKIKILTALGVETCESAFSPDFYAQAFGDLSHESIASFDVAIPPLGEVSQSSATQLSQRLLSDGEKKYSGAGI